MYGVWYEIPYKVQNIIQMIVKIHKTDKNNIILAICDSDLLGKKFEEKNKQLDLTSNFYNGQEMSDKEVCDLMRKAYIINLVGKKSITLAINGDLISGNNINKIKGIPYAQCVL